MNISNKKELKEIVQLCRKLGVESIEVDGVKITLSREAPQRQSRKPREEPADPISEPVYSEMDTLFWSSAGIPEEQDNA